MSWIKTAKVGDKVVCVGDFSSCAEEAAERGDALPVLGRVYTIREILACECMPMVFLLLDEIRNGINEFGTEGGFASDGFLPVDARKTDISIFTAMLKPADARVSEGA